MHEHQPLRVAFAAATAAALTGDLLTGLKRDDKTDLPTAPNGENGFDGLVTVLKGSASGMTTSDTTAYGPIHLGLSTGHDLRLSMIMFG
ncbi:hypothetical protein [Streptomyces cadmiisoli]|uniref:hypothetical protein n=1 Tax=Streptomyces cadmiisoli TaxID=2184053 RepID=UPI003D70D15F